MALASPALAVRLLTASATWEAHKEYTLRNNKNNNESYHFLSLCSVPGPKPNALCKHPSRSAGDGGNPYCTRTRISAPRPLSNGTAPGFRPHLFVFRPPELHHLAKLPPSEAEKVGGQKQLHSGDLAPGRERPMWNQATWFLDLSFPWTQCMASGDPFTTNASVP